MSRNVFAICDPEVDYVCRLAEYLYGRLGTDFEIQIFTGAEPLCAYGGIKAVALLLISSVAMSEEIENMTSGQIVLLSEGEIPEKWERYPSVYKYQDVKTLTGEVLGYYAGTAEEKTMLPWGQNLCLYGVYSPAPPIEKTAFALAFGQRLAQEGKVLYLNLEDFTGFEFLLDQHFQSDLSDLLYLVRQGQEELIYRLENMIETVEHLDYVPPSYLPGDLTNMTLDEWKRLLEQLTSLSDYQVVLVEVNGQMQGLMGFLNLCDRIYLPIGEDVFSVARRRQYEQVVRMQGRISVLEKTTVLHLPVRSRDREGEIPVWNEMREYVEQLVRKEAGAYAKGILRGTGIKKTAVGTPGSDKGDFR